jgi:hypothetical protein
MMSHASSGIVCSMRSYVNPAVVTTGSTSRIGERRWDKDAPLLTIWFSLPYRLEKEKEKDNKAQCIGKRKGVRGGGN